jgi:hypothetical protein
LSGQLFSLNYKGVLTEIQYKDNKRCMDIYKQALAIAKQTASPYNIAVCQNSIGGLYSITWVSTPKQNHTTIAVITYI